MRRTFLSLCLAGLLTTLAIAPAAAATLRIDITDLNLKFQAGEGDEGGVLTDSNSFDGVVDPLATMDFFLDNVRIGSLSSDIFADVFIPNIGDIPEDGGPVKADYGLFTLFTNDLFNQSVMFGLEKINLTFTPFGDAKMQLSGAAPGIVLDQSLKSLFGVEFNLYEPIDVLFTLHLSNIETYQGYIQKFDGVGTGSVHGEANVVPEPASLLLLGAGLLGAARMRRRASRKAEAA